MTINRVAVVGAGTMGHGIAQICATQGIEVFLCDLDQSVIDRAKASIDTSLSRFVSKGRLEESAKSAALKKLNFSSQASELNALLPKVDLVVEAVPERMDLKLALFRQFEEHAKTDALLASNTSSLSITEIAGGLTHPERVIGLHFFNPVPIMKLLEVVRGLRTTDETVKRARAFGEQVGKETVLVNDWPGFATSRLGIILGCEAIRMVEQGVAKPEDIDKAMELGYRHPMGPLRLTDLVGLDVRLAIMEHLHAELGEQFRPPALLRQMVRAGKLGRKSGEGFYVYE